MEAKQCYECGGSNHIERYCPNRMSIQHVRGEPLAGTRKWIEKHDLDRDPRTRDRILHALRAAPGSAIFKDGVCIYPGIDKHFSTESGMALNLRGRALEDRITRRRSRSISPDRRDRLSQSPIRDDTMPARGRSGNYSPETRYRGPSSWKYSPEPRYEGPPIYQSRSNYRSRSPPTQRRRTPSPWGQRGRLPSPYQEVRSPPHISGGAVAATVVDARNNLPENNPPTQTVDDFRFSFPRAEASKATGFPAFTSGVPGRTTLGDVSNINKTITTPKQIPIDQLTETIVRPSQAPLRSPITVEDPFFVLGIDKNAEEAE